MWSDPHRVAKVKGQNTYYNGGFSFKDSMLSSSPMSFYLQGALKKFVK